MPTTIPEKLQELRTNPVSTRDWGLFGLRWVIPAGLLVFALANTGGLDAPALRPALALAAGLALVNLIVALLLLVRIWGTPVLLLVLLVDSLACAGAVILVDAGLAWMGLVPVALSGLYFGWPAGMVHGAAAALLMAAALTTGERTLASPWLLAGLAGFPAAGALAALLGREGLRQQADHEARQRELDMRVEAVTRRAKDFMAVVYDMAEVLSASKLDPNRVLDSAVSFGLEGLSRVGVEPPLFSTILLFALDDGEPEAVLRVACASSTVTPSDHRVAVPGLSGAISRALGHSAPVLSHAPDFDPELREFETFRQCKTVLCLPLKAGPENYGVMLVGSHAAGAFEELHVELMWAVANQAAASLHNAKLYAALLEQRDRLVGVEKSARAQLAAALHDGPTQGMSAITMRLNYIRRLLDRNPESAVDELYKIEDLARRTAKEVRMMLFELRPKSLEHGLSYGLEQLVQKMQETYSLNVELEIQPGIDGLLDPQATLALFSIVTEALHNARKHARASLIRIVVGARSDQLVLLVEDDGQGFDVSTALEAANQREGHLGLNNLYDRAALIEGELVIDSAPGQGTRLSVAVPLDVLRALQAEQISRQVDGQGAQYTAGLVH